MTKLLVQFNGKLRTLIRTKTGSSLKRTEENGHNKSLFRGNFGENFRGKYDFSFTKNMCKDVKFNKGYLSQIHSGVARWYRDGVVFF